MRRAMLSSPPLNEMDELALDHTAEESVFSKEDLCCKRIFHTFHSPPETGNVLFYSLTWENQERDINFTHLKVGTTTGNSFFFYLKLHFIVCVAIHRHVCALWYVVAHMQRPENNLWESMLSFYHVSPRDCTPVKFGS